MHTISSFVFSALLLSSEALAAATTKSYVTCVTKNGPKSTSTIRTSSAVLTIPFYGFKFTTTTPQKTITPKPTTTTLSETTTLTTVLTLAQETDTISETTTISDTTTITETETTSTTSTSYFTSTSTPSTTIPATAGFIPIKSSIPNAAKRRAIAGKPNDAPVENALEERGAIQYNLLRKDGKDRCEPALYPTAVKCVGVVKVITTSTITKTARTRTVFATTPTSSVTTTFTETSTSTETPVRASTTLSFTDYTTSTVTETTTLTSSFSETQTVSAVAPTSTYYAACGSDNIITSINGGQPIGGARFASPDYFATLNNVPNAYECCVACINTPNCGGTYGYPGVCFLHMQSENVCSQNNVAYRLFTSGSASAFASNGYCGQNGLL